MNTTGSGDTFVGYLANPGSAGLTNATAIGASAQVTASNSMVLGGINGVNGATANTNVGIGTTAPGATLDVEAPSGSTPSVNFGSSSNNANFTVNGNTSISGTLTVGGTQIVSSGMLSDTVVNAGTSFGLGGHAGFASGSSPNANAFFGWAGNSGMTGAANTAVGVNALGVNSTGAQNTANGAYALFYNTGSNNTASGYQALFNNGTGTGKRRAPKPLRMTR